MNVILDLPDLVLENIALKLEILDLKNFRLSCRRFCSLALSKAALEKMAINLKRLNKKDLNCMFVFLESISFGKFVTLRINQNNKNAGKVMKFAKNLNSFEGDIEHVNNLVSYSPMIKCLHFICELEEKYYDAYRFENYICELNRFEFLEDLHIHNCSGNNIGKLPVSHINVILKNAVRLTKLGFARICFQHDNEPFMEHINSDEINEPTFMIQPCSVMHWIFNHVDTEGFKIILPSTTVSIDKISSPNILWDKITKLQRVLCAYHFEPQHSPIPKIDDVFQDNIDNFCLYIRRKRILEKMKLIPDVKNVKEYKSFTFVTSCITSPLIDRMISIVGMVTLTKIYLINRHGSNGHEQECSDHDIIKILKFYINLNEMILESFHSISVDLVKTMCTMSLNLQLFKIINCRSFNHDDIMDKMKTKNMTFKIGVLKNSSKFLKSLFDIISPVYK